MGGTAAKHEGGIYEGGNGLGGGMGWSRLPSNKQKNGRKPTKFPPVRPVHLKKDGALALGVVLACGRVLEVLVLSLEARTEPERAAWQKRQNAHHLANHTIIYPSKRQKRQRTHHTAKLGFVSHADSSIAYNNKKEIFAPPVTIFSRFWSNRSAHNIKKTVDTSF